MKYLCAIFIVIPIFLNAQTWNGNNIVFEHSTLGGNSDRTAFYRNDLLPDQTRLLLQLGDDNIGFFEIGFADWDTSNNEWKNLITFDLNGTVELKRSGSERKKIDFGAFSYLESRNVSGDNNSANSYGTAILRNAYITDHLNNVYLNPNGYLESQKMEMRAGNWYFDYRPTQHGVIGNWTENQWQNKFFINGNSGNVGIGTASPQAGLEINRGNTNSNALILSSSGPGWGSGVLLKNSSTNGKPYGFYSGSDGNLHFSDEVTYEDRILVHSNGNVGIGTNNPNQKLTVNGTIYGKEVKVDLQVPGPDYVFEPSYKLPSLTEIESYIKANKHLPEVPSAKEMEANGINLSEMNMLLLKKVEELTLHQIEANKKIELLQNQVLELLQNQNKK